MGSGGQSWLVGYDALSGLVPGVHAMPLLRPPMHVPLAQRGQGWMPGVPDSVSPVRKTSDASGRLMVASPEEQLRLPLAGPETLLMTHTLVGVLFAFGTASGAAKRQPTSEQVRGVPVSTEVVEPSVALCPTGGQADGLHRGSGIEAGSGTEFCRRRSTARCTRRWRRGLSTEGCRRHRGVSSTRTSWNPHRCSRRREDRARGGGAGRGGGLVVAPGRSTTS
jgi:hypothetical protein